MAGDNEQPGLCGREVPTVRRRATQPARTKVGGTTMMSSSYMTCYDDIILQLQSDCITFCADFV